MKRQILTLGAICAAAFTLTNCNKEIAEPKAPETEGIPFEIVAATADTKTANEGPNTVWAAGDALTVFHAEAGSTAYGNNDKFTYTGSGNKFKGTLKTALGGARVTTGMHCTRIMIKLAPLPEPLPKQAIITL